MTQYIIASRAAIIFCFALVSAEILFDATEAELERCGAELQRLPAWSCGTL